MANARRQELIQRYENAIQAVTVALDHLSETDLDRRPLPEARSARELIHLLFEEELHESISLRRMLAENEPVLHSWDKDRYIERLHSGRPIAAAFTGFRAVALANIDLLGYLTEEQWRREGNQQRPWPQTVEAWLEDRVTALHNDLMHILNAPSGGRAIADPS
jgi:hypothetical protein